MSFKKYYIEEAIYTLLQLNPEWKREDIESIVKDKVKEKFQDPGIFIDNNITGINEKITLSKLCDIIYDNNYVMSGNATFYCQPEVLESPTSKMLTELKLARKNVKNEMFKYKRTDDEYKQLDLVQTNAKVVMNAEYGASGAPTAAFYNKYTPAATTLMAQSIITVMAAFFEGFVADNHKFFHINECLDWMNKVKTNVIVSHEWIQSPSPEEVIFRIKKQFYQYDLNDTIIIENYIKNCTRSELIHIFYKNNLNEFIRRHIQVQKIIRNILVSLPLYEASEKDIPSEFINKFENVDEYNKWISKEMFLNPYDVPDNIKNKMKELNEIINQYCYIDYITPDSIVKLNNHKRKAILLVDTDSNMINANIFVEFILDEIFEGESFSRSKFYNQMICCNILANILSNCVSKILEYYGTTHNMNQDARTHLVMKNEFLFKRLFLMNKKKRYASSIVLREGNIMIPFKTEIKGVDFIKAGVTDEVTNRFTKILEDCILFSDDINLHGLMKELKRFEKEIYNDLKKGGTKYLKTQTYKEEAAYKKIPDKDTEVEVSHAWALPVFRAVTVWNIINPLQKIYSLDRVKILKLVVTGPTDLDGIKDKYPNEYKIIINNIFNSTNPEIVKGGLKVLAIPSSVKQIPKWAIEFINYDVIISDVFGSFRSILEAFQIEELNLKTPNGNASIISSLISI
jgi:DNA polymerase elongation subunit (family B)